MSENKNKKTCPHIFPLEAPIGAGKKARGGTDSGETKDVKDKMSTMQDIFSLQEMYDIKNKEKKLEDELRKLGYIN